MDKSVSCYNLMSKFYVVVFNKKWLFINFYLLILIIVIDFEVLNYYKLIKLGFKILFKLISILREDEEIKNCFF